MQLWVGLGNPGPRYAMHRHNVGFMAADVIADVHGFGPVQKKFQGWLQEGRIGGEKVLLLKPATFMNESGRSVGEALQRAYRDTVLPARDPSSPEALGLAPVTFCDG